ncbi:GreA/GreB family elongation factor [Luteolibacter arcticus]|uniref:GreA/GreB family elongation factor n=1 Tax=Luteolibacter arcticus TaxID=1581411 RepID=A0ABT3GMV2_9BACT|nr:GreA/GreB family elongation factor [Luteolibacter arcticus]MCW1924800.1 GreA/GreB family elongation factor [Luteolibacter arcticus]
MNSLRLFDADGHARLRHLLDTTDTPRPTPDQRKLLAALLEESSITRNPDELANRIAPGDRVLLVSPDDPRDWYELELVMPHDADVDADRISLLTPLGLALLGQRKGAIVAWEVPAGMREMKIESIVKLASALA